MRLLSPILTVVILLALSASLTGNAAVPKQESLTAQEILQRMAKVYASCRSYHDSGVVSTVTITARGQRTEKKPFTTAFVRPDRFRFEYTERIGNDLASHFIVWRKGDDVRTWWNVMPNMPPPQSLEMALAGATGVSGGSAHYIPAMLIPNEISGYYLTDLTGTRRLQNAKLGGVECFRIQGRPVVGGSLLLWIDTQTFLVRRIDDRLDVFASSLGNFHAELTTTYEPVVNGKVTDKMLEFNPPK